MTHMIEISPERLYWNYAVVAGISAFIFTLVGVWIARTQIRIVRRSRADLNAKVAKNLPRNYIG